MSKQVGAPADSRIPLRRIGIGAAVFGLTVMLCLMVFQDKGIADYQRQLARQAEMAADVRRITFENIALLREIERLNDDMAYIESIARTQLGMVAADEWVLTFPGK